MERCSFCAVTSFSPWPSIKDKAQKGKVNDQFPENMNSRSSLTADEGLALQFIDCILSSNICFYKCKDTANTVFSYMFNTISLGKQHEEKKSLVFDSHSHDRSFALTEDQAFCSTERLCCEQYSDYSAIFYHVFSQTTFRNENTEAHAKIHWQPASLTSILDFIHRPYKWGSSIFLGSLWCCALGLGCPFSLPLGNTSCTGWSYHESRRNPRWSTGSIQARYVFRNSPVKSHVANKRKSRWEQGVKCYKSTDVWHLWRSLLSDGMRSTEETVWIFPIAKSTEETFPFALVTFQLFRTPKASVIILNWLTRTVYLTVRDSQTFDACRKCWVTS